MRMAHNASHTRPSSLHRLQHRGFSFALIFLVALGFRSCAVISRPETPIADPADYHQLAVALAEGHGYVNTAGAETAWRPPGYPAFLSVIYRVAGPSVRAATFAQAFVGSLTVLLLMLFSSTIFGRLESIVAGCIAAVYPGLVWLPRLLLSENLSLLLTLTTIWSIAMYLKSRRLWWLALFGVVGGLNTLVRGGNLLLPALIGTVLLAVTLKNRSVNWKPLCAGLLLAAAAFIIVLTPWTVRNYRVFHRFVPIATQDGLTLYASYWPPQENGKLIWGTLPGTEDPNVATATKLEDEVAASKYLQHVTMQRLREQPGYFFRLIPSKMISLLAPFDWEMLPHAAGSTRSVNVGYLLIILPSLFGLVMLMRTPRPNQWLLWVIPVMVLIQAIFFYGSPRFRLPAEPMAILLAAVFLSHFVRSRTGFLKTRPPLLG